VRSSSALLERHPVDCSAFEVQFRKKFVENERGERKDIQQLADYLKARFDRIFQTEVDRYRGVS